MTKAEATGNTQEVEPEEVMNLLGSSLSPAHLFSPAEDAGKVSARRPQTVDMIGRAITREHASRWHPQSWAQHRPKLAAVALIAAGILLALGFRWRIDGLTTSGGVSAPVSALSFESHLSDAHGLVQLRREGGLPVKMAVGAALNAGDTVSTADGATAKLSLPGGIDLALNGSTELGLTAPPNATGSAPASPSRANVAIATRHVSLSRGRLHASVDPTPTKFPKLTVHTPDVDVVVTGTIFTVDVKHFADGRVATAVAVVRGQVVVQQGGAQKAKLSAGESWSSGAISSGVADSASSEVAGPDWVPDPGSSAVPRAAASGSAVSSETVSSESSAVGTLADENRLFQAAAAAKHSGRAADQIRLLRRLLGRYVGSALEREVRAELMRALVRSGQKFQAQLEARRYLKAYPSGPARAEAQSLLDLPDDKASPTTDVSP